ncbi:hypothetical protein [Amaricoccus sp.]|uniref:hypothetical protein n=1 Tax=Amaricoccus sp. TaxID=1872485 RepID=UPI003FA5B1DA
MTPRIRKLPAPKPRPRYRLTNGRGHTLGLALRIEVHSAGVQDRDGAAPVPGRISRRFPFIERFLADAGCQGPRVAAAAPRPVAIIERTETGFVVQRTAASLHRKGFPAGNRSTGAISGQPAIPAVSGEPRAA